MSLLGVSNEYLSYPHLSIPLGGACYSEGVCVGRKAAIEGPRRRRSDEADEQATLNDIEQRLDDLFRITQEGISTRMTDISTLQAAVDKLGVDASADHAAIIAAFTDAGAKLDALAAQVAALTAGAIDQATIDALAAAVEAADTSINDTAAAVVPVVTPPTP